MFLMAYCCTRTFQIPLPRRCDWAEEHRLWPSDERAQREISDRSRSNRAADQRCSDKCEEHPGKLSQTTLTWCGLRPGLLDDADKTRATSRRPDRRRSSRNPRGALEQRYFARDLWTKDTARIALKRCARLQETASCPG